MKLILFGATGHVDRLLVKQALSKGYQVTAFVRNPDTLQVKDNNLFLFEGNILDSKSVDEAIKGQDVVISTLGNKTSSTLWKPSTIISAGVRNILDSIRAHKVKRLLFVASFGVNENIFLPEKILIHLLLKNLFADIPLQEDLIKKSGLDYTIVHPARLTDEKAIEIYKAE